RDALGRRIDVDDRVLFPGARALLVGPAAPELGHRPAIEDDGNRSADIAALAEALAECLAHRLKAGFARPLDINAYRGHRSPPRAAACGVAPEYKENRTIAGGSRRSEHVTTTGDLHPGPPR